MLSHLNLIANAYVSAAVIDACQRAGLFFTLTRHPAVSFKSLNKIHHANPGYLAIALHLLESIGWVERDVSGKVVLSADATPSLIIPGTHLLYQACFETLLTNTTDLPFITEQLKLGLRVTPTQQPLQHGALMLPLLTALHHTYPSAASFTWDSIHDELRLPLQQFLMHQGLATETGFTKTGLQLIDRADVMSIAASYRPLLARLGTLLFGHADQVFQGDQPGSQTHIDWRMNVHASGSQHQRYHTALEQIVVNLFNTADFASQPDCIADMGCGDGCFLRHLYQTIATKTQRGQVLKDFPVMLIGADLNQQALDETARTLADLPHILINADISDPQRFEHAIQAHGIDAQQVLHVRSFVDHNFTIAHTKKHSAEKFLLTPGGVYVDAKGHALDPNEVVRHWREHLARWAQIINSHGLIAAEAHCLNAQQILQYPTTECLYFDHLHAFSAQYLIEAEIYVILAANVGLFAKVQPFRTPKTLPFCRTTISHFIRRPYQIRHARLSDEAALIQLEQRCWPMALQNTPQQLRQRLVIYPQGQFVLVLDDQVVGVIYSQRIQRTEDLAGATNETAFAHHRVEGALAQLLAVNILPALQARNLGDELLEFMLQRCSVMPGIEAVVAITRCKNFQRQSHTEIAQYIQQHDEQGRCLDPVLRMHQRHGATITGLAENYRPKDSANQGHGVWVHYDIHHRHAEHFSSEGSCNDSLKESSDNDPISTAAELSQMQINSVVHTSICSCLNASNRPGYNADRPLMEMGLDSSDLLMLREQLQNQYHITVASTFFFEHNTPNKVVQALHQRLNPRSDRMPELVAPIDASAVPEIASVSLRSNDHPDYDRRKQEDIAIIGMSCRLPGHINTPEALWNALKEGFNPISDFPPERWQWNQDISDRPGIGRGGFLEDIARFDPAFFRISPREAELMDPQQRILLELSWEAIEHAAYRASQTANSMTGVFVGASGSDYQLLQGEHHVPVHAHSGLSNSMAILANRLSYFYNWQGPSLCIDTACSSSLVALYNAVESLRNKKCDQALVGGINILCHPNNSLAYYRAGMLSPDGQCKTFDASANGYVRAEGGIVMLLKPLGDAERDRDRIFAVIKGVACNHGGQAGGLTVPNPQQQAQLLQQAWRNAKVAPHTLSYIEAHGTGTPLGDPIEVQGILQALQQANEPSKLPHCGIGSIKSNLGHLEAAAGLAGLLKIVLGMQYKEIPATLHFKTLNPHIELREQLTIIDQHQPWYSPHQQPRRAGVSSFGSGGTNAHAVVEEYQQRSPTEPVFNGPVLIILSAKNSERLKEYVGKLLVFINDNEAINLVNLAYSLQVGREAMEERLGLIVASRNELQEKLQQVLDGKQSIEQCYQGQVKRHQETLALFTADDDMAIAIQAWITKRKFQKLLDLWVKGLIFDWSTLYPDIQPQRISAPTYPFAKDRYWVETSVSQSAFPNTRNGSVQLHPLLHQNTSALDEQRFTSTFTGEEFFLADHVVQGHKVLPGVAYLEMANAATRQALRMNGEAAASLQLSNIVWSRPLVVDEVTTVHIALYPEEQGQIAFEVYSTPDTATSSSEPLLHSQGFARLISASSQSEQKNHLGLTELQAQFIDGSNSKGVSIADCYKHFDAMGLHYGTAHRAIAQLYRDAERSEVLAQLQLPALVQPTLNQYTLHPSLLDGAFQATIAMTMGGQSKPALPFALDQINILRTCTATMWAWIRMSPGSSDRVKKIDIVLFDDAGNVCTRLLGFSSRLIEDLSESSNSAQAAPAPEEIRSVMLHTQWLSKDLTDREADHGRLADQHLIMLCGLEQYQTVLQESLPQVHWIRLNEAARCGEDLATRYEYFATQLFEQIQTELKNEAKPTILIQILIANQSEALLATGLLGLLRCAELENPRFQGQLMIVEEPGAEPETLVSLINANARQRSEQQIRYLNGQRQVAQWQEIEQVELASDMHSMVWKEDGIYLITGGAGGLGLLFAKEILKQTNTTQVVLSGRTERHQLNPVQQVQLDAERLHYLSADITQADQVQQLIQQIQSEIGELTGIIHSAGIIRDNFIRNKTVEEFQSVLAPKVSRPFNLDQATQHLPLEQFILFSSVAGSLGNIGQADYAAANGFMDAFARWRNQQVATQQRHGQTIAIAWPLWEEGGMQVDAATRSLMQTTHGLVPMQTQQGIDALYLALSHTVNSNDAHVLVLHGQTTRIQKVLGMAAIDSTILIPPALTSTRPGSTQTPSVVNINELAQAIQQALSQSIAQLLKINSNDLDADSELSDYGFDSISLTEWSNRLNQQYGLEISPTLLFEYPTIATLANYFATAHQSLFAQRLLAGETSSEVLHQLKPTMLPLQPASHRRRFASTAAVNHVSPTEPIAIIGMAGRFPQAEDIEAFWNNLKVGKDCISEIPMDRWDWHAVWGDPNKEPNKTNIKWGGFMDGVDEFDPMFFGISPREAQLMDPQQRLLMQYVWLAIEDAGYSAQSISGSHTALFIGTGASGYSSLIERSAIAIEGYTATGMVPSVGPNRMSYFLNLHGPSEPIETACSSSLVAIYRAVQCIQAGECDQAIVGGVNTIVTPDAHIGFNKAGMLCEDGHCKTFSKDANGYVRGEGVAMLMVKRLSMAERDRDHIYAVIRSATHNHGGRANSLTAPNPKAQAEVVQMAYQKADLNSGTVTHIETHGTGTSLGDPIEINGLKAAFAALGTGQPESPQPWCALGAVKTHIGHLELAAGVAGVIKVVKELQHHTLIGNLHCSEQDQNPLIELNNSPFYLAHHTQDWPVMHDSNGNALPRLAGISSFGFGGANAHVVVEEYRQPERSRSTQAGAVMIVLSAKNPERLKDYASKLLAFINHNQEINLADLAYTLQVGREAMEERLGFIVTSSEQLQDKLQQYLDGKPSIEQCYQGQVKCNKEVLAAFTADEDMADTIAAWIAKHKFHKLLDLWVKGLAVDWNKHDPQAKPQRISAPTYPFAKERYWIHASGSTQTPASGLSFESVLHPLLGCSLPLANDDRCYMQSLRLDALGYINDHVILDAVLFPGAGYVEIAFALAKQLTADHRFAIHDLSIQRPLCLSSEECTRLQTIAKPDQAGAYLVSCYSQHISNNKTTTWQLQAQWQCKPEEKGSTAPSMDLTQIQQQLQHSPDTALLYDRFAELGLNFGLAFQTIQAYTVNATESWARIKTDAMLDDYIAHPLLIDGGLQASGFTFSATHNDPMLPTGLAQCMCYQKLPAEVWVHSCRHQLNDDHASADLRFYNQAGDLLLDINGFQTRRATKENLRKQLIHHQVTDDWLYQTVWQLHPISADSVISQHRRWFIVGNLVHGTPFPNAETCHYQQAGVAYLRDVLMGENAPTDIVFITEENTVDVVHTNWISEQLPALLILAQTLAQTKTGRCPRFWLITQQGQSVLPKESVNPWQSAWSGFYKTLCAEQPQLACAWIDIDQFSDWVKLVRQETPLGECIAYRDNKRYVARLLPYKVAQASQHSLELPQAPVQLTSRQQGIIDSLRFERVVQQRLNDDSVRVEVRASSLNFRDVLNAMNLYPGDAGLLGSECAGIVEAVGKNVSTFKVGDAVIVWGEGCLASEVTVSELQCAHQPSHCSFAQAAAIPAVFSTVWFALHKTAQLTPADWLLVHSAAGGVGLAAIQYARQIGAQLIVTAGTKAKRTYLQSLGLPYVLDSRSFDYVDQINTITCQHGVDVVLNYATGDYIAQTLKATAQNARFIEIGKRDIWTMQQMQAARADIDYHIIAVDHFIQAQPAQYQQELNHLLTWFEQGRFKPLPITSFDVTQAIVAFRYMQQGQQIGKVVLERKQLLTIQSDASYLITGGLGGLGLQAAAWLTKLGAKSLILVGRHAPTAAAQDTIDAIQNQGVQVHVVAADVSNQQHIVDLFKTITTTLSPLKGLLHIAGMIDDGLLADQTPERFSQVCATKIAGSWHLHEATKNRALDFFVMFSSTASSMGSPGQINYATANAFLDGLAYYRSYQGLCALSVNWGPWAEAGMAVQHADRHSATGVKAIPINQGFAILQQQLADSAPQIMVAHLDWQLLSRRGLKQSPLLDALLTKHDEHEDDFLNGLQSATAEQRSRRIKEKLFQLLRDTLHLSTASVLDGSQGFFELGLDSLMAMEFRNQLASQFKLQDVFDHHIVFKYPSIDLLVPYVEEQVVANLNNGSLRSTHPMMDGVIDEGAVDVVSSPSDTVAETQNNPECLSEQLTDNEWLPLSFNQFKWWLIGRRAVPAVRYFLRGQLDVNQLERAIHDVVKHQPMLWRQFDQLWPLQKQTQAHDHWHIEVIRQTTSEEERDQEFRQLRNKHLFSMTLPLITVRLFELTPDSFDLQIGMPHIISDGYSFNLFRQLVNQTYLSLSQKANPINLIPPLSYEDCIAKSAHQPFIEYKKYWKRTLGDQKNGLTLPMLTTAILTKPRSYLLSVKKSAIQENILRRFNIPVSTFFVAIILLTLAKIHQVNHLVMNYLDQGRTEHNALLMASFERWIVVSADVRDMTLAQWLAYINKAILDSGSFNSQVYPVDIANYLGTQAGSQQGVQWMTRLCCHLFNRMKFSEHYDKNGLHTYTVGTLSHLLILYQNKFKKILLQLGLKKRARSDFLVSLNYFPYQKNDHQFAGCELTSYDPLEHGEHARTSIDWAGSVYMLENQIGELRYTLLGNYVDAAHRELFCVTLDQLVMDCMNSENGLRILKLLQSGQ